MESSTAAPKASNDLARRIVRVYLTLQFGNALAASFIWGINTLFLLNAGLSDVEAFAANAFFTAGMVLCDIPTGVVADVWGRRTSYLLGTLTLAGSTFLYWLLWEMKAPLWSWAIVSTMLGLGGLTHAFWLTLVLLAAWAMVFAAEIPIRQAYLNAMIPSHQRATVLSFASSMGSTGGVVIQPTLGMAADAYGYATSLVLGGAIQLLSAPFLYLSRRERATADMATGPAAATAPPLDPDTGPAGLRQPRSAPGGRRSPPRGHRATEQPTAPFPNRVRRPHDLSEVA